MLAHGRTVSWSQLKGRVARIAGALRSSGVAAGDRVCLLSLNRPEFLEIQYAVAWAGAILVPLNFRFTAPELCCAIQKSRSSLLVVDAHFAEVVKSVRCELPELQVLWIGNGAADEDYERLLGGEPVADAVPENTGSVAGIFFTGGTTGTPRGVALSHASLCVHYLEMREALNYDASSVYAHVMPMFHLAGFGMGNALTMAAGTHCFLDQFSPHACLDLVSRCGVTHLSLVPTMISMLLDEVEGGPVGSIEALASVKMISYGAAPIEAVLLERLLRIIPNVRLRQFYGMTELSGACVSLAPEFHGLDKLELMQCAGQSMATSEVEIVRSDGSRCEINEVGEIVVRGAQVMLGYWDDPTGTAQALRDGWMHTEDLGSMDALGFVRICGRSKDLIISGGENIFALEVENALASHPQVLQSAIIGLPDERWGERVHAVIVVAHRLGTDALVEVLEKHCRGLIANYKIPRSWSFREEPLPLSGVGKVQKQKLRAEFTDHAS